MQQISEFLKQAASQFTAISDSPELDMQVLLAHTLDKPRTWVLAHPEAPLTPPQLAAVERAVSRLQAGEPLAYVLGHWEFYGLDFIISHDVLIPRPETELLVEQALDWLRAAPKRRRIADVGTGSGCIAVALAVNLPDASILATDVSLPALEIARRNARRHKVAERIEFIECALLPDNTLQKFDLICANLPYIPTETLHNLSVYGREPTLALNGGTDGLDTIRQLLNLAPEHLAPGGMVLLEIEASQGLDALSLAYNSFTDARIFLRQDLAGRDRLLGIELSNRF